MPIKKKSDFQNVGITFLVGSSEIVINGLLLCTTRNNIIVKLTPPPVPLGINEHDIVPAMVIPAVYQDGVKRISGRRRLWCLQVRI